MPRRLIAQGKYDELHDGTVQFLACKEQLADWGSGVHMYLEFFDLQHAVAQAEAGDGGGGGGADGWAAVKERCGVLLTELEQADRKWGDGLQHGPCAAAGNTTRITHTPSAHIPVRMMPRAGPLWMCAALSPTTQRRMMAECG